MLKAIRNYTHINRLFNTLSLYRTKVRLIFLLSANCMKCLNIHRVVCAMWSGEIV